MNFEEKYRIEIDKLEVSESLTKKTLQKMKNEKSNTSPASNSLDQKKTGNRKKKGKLLSFSIPIVIAATLFLFISTKTPSNPILTLLTDNQHVANVQLSEGQIHFDSVTSKNDTIIQMNPNFGLNAEPLKSPSEGDFVEEGFFFPKDWENFKVLEKEYASFFSKKQDANIYQYKYLLSDEMKNIEIDATNERSSIKETNSQIGEIELYLSYSEDDQVYYGEFNKNEITYKITAESLTEKEFITFLLFFLE